MNAILQAIIEREAEKLAKMSKSLADEPLSADDLDRLERLARCAKYLRAPMVEAKDPDDDAGPATSADLKAVE